MDVVINFLKEIAKDRLRNYVYGDVINAGTNSCSLRKYDNDVGGVYGFLIQLDDNNVEKFFNEVKWALWDFRE